MPTRAAVAHRSLAWPVLLVAGLLAGGPARAISTRWLCTDRRPLTLDATPEEAHVQFEGQAWVLRRVHDREGARWVDSRHGVAVLTRGRALTLQRGDSVVSCKLQSDVLNPPGAASAPPDGAATPGR